MDCSCLLFAGSLGGNLSCNKHRTVPPFYLKLIRMKNLKYFIISFFMLGAYISASAYDFSSLTRKDDALALDSVRLYYSINPDGATVSVTQGPATYNFGSAEIPETVTYEGKTYTVTEIAYNAFGNARISRIEMANTITAINDYAFSNSGIDSISFSKELKTIGNYAFYHSDLKSVILQEKVEMIGNFAFAGDGSGNYIYGQIIKVKLPKSLKNIGEHAFSCNRLNSVIIPDEMTDINKYAFSGCLYLNEVVFPEGLKKIGYGAFFNCGINELNLPSTVEELGQSAFEQNVNLNKVILPNSVNLIGERCFQACNTLQSITFSSGMTVIPNAVCYSCVQLTDVIIPEGITTIGSNAFLGTTRLSSISLPESVVSVGTGVFSNSGISSFKFPSKLEALNASMFSSCNYLTEIEIPSTVKNIGTNTFYFCASLTKVILPEGIEEIGDQVFGYCSKLTDVNIPTTVKTIGAGAFINCKSLEKMILPDSVAIIKNSAFSGCILIDSIDLPKTVKVIEGSCFHGCDSLKSIRVYHNVSEIGQFAFYECLNLKKVHLKRAIIPSIDWLNSNYTAYIENGNNCTLCVPTGCKATYEASNLWNNFDTIVEEEIGYDILYRVSASKTGQGSIAINGETKTSVDILSGTKVGVTFTPASGWKLKSVVLNDKDVTASLVDNEYVIDDLDANMVFVAMFEELPAILSLRSADGGSIDVPVEKGKTFSCVFTPDENWSINNVRYNNADVTLSVSESGEYTTPVIKYDATLSVAYETGDNSVEAIGVDADMKAYVLSDGLLVVEGTMHGMPVVVYDADGKVLSSLVTVDGRCSYQLPDAGVYLVKGISKTIKVVY